MSNTEKTVAIIGGGPVGLAAAAHVLGRGLKPVVLEAGDKVGHAVRQWSHVRMFSPWSYNVDKAAEALLREEGWNSPEPERYPTGGELVAQYLEPLATRTKLSQHIQTNARVAFVGRVGFDKVKTAGREYAPFEIRYRNGKGPSILRADAVIQGGTDPAQNIFKTDLSKQQFPETEAWYAPSMYNIVRQNGQDMHIVIKPDKACEVNSGLGSIRGARMAEMSYSRPRATQQQRLTSPMVFRYGQMQPTTWDDALDLVARVTVAMIKEPGGEDNLFVSAFDHGGRFWHDSAPPYS